MVKADTKDLVASEFPQYIGIKKGPKNTCRLTIGKEHLNALGTGHGGAIFTLADHAFGEAVRRAGKKCVAMEVKINYVSAVRSGDVLTTDAEIIKTGKSTTVVLIRIKRRHECVAIAMATGFNL